MTDTLAKIKIGKLSFETIVDLNSAIKLKKGLPVNIEEVIRDVAIYTDQKKGMRAGKNELMLAFNTTEFPKIVETIVKKGEIEVTKEFRDETLENRKKQIVDFLVKNGINSQTNRPFIPDMIENALKQSKVKIENQPVDKQIKKIIEKLKEVIPIKLETKKIRIKISPEYTGRVYGIVQEYKEKEEWFDNGSLEVILNIPQGVLMDFYDKLNSITHGSAITSEIKE